MTTTETCRIDDLEARVRRLEARFEPPPRVECHPRSTPRDGDDTRRVPTPQRAPTPAPAPQPARDLEELLGGRVLGWIGGTAVVAGLALLFAIGISHGWIGEQARTLMGAALSLALVAVGVRLHERGGRHQAARAAAGAGVAGLFMTVTVAAAVYDLVPDLAGLALAAAAGALAARLALRWSSPLVGALGVAGTVLAPVLVGAPSGALTLAFELLAVGAATAVLLRERWDWLALGVFALSAPQWLAWLYGDADGAAGALLVLTLFGGLYAAAAVGLELRMPAIGLRPVSAFLLGLNALVLAVAGFYALADLSGDGLATAWLGALGAAHLAAGAAADRSRRISRDIGLLCLVLAVVLGDVTFALAVDGPARAFGFAGVSLAFAALVRRERARTDAVLAELGLGGHIALAAIQALHDVDGSQLLAPGASGTAIASLVAVAAGCLVSARLADAGRPEWRVALDAGGLGALAVIGLLTLDGPALTMAWAAEAVALAGIAAARRDVVARIAAPVHLAGALIYALADQAPPSGLVDGATVLGPAALGLVAVTAAAMLSARALGDRDDLAMPLRAAAGVTGLYLTSLTVVALSPEAIDGTVQQGQLQLSALWAATGVATLVLGLLRGSQPLRLGALALLGLATAKVFLFDLAALTSVYRATSFLGLGLLLLAGALAYQRMRPQLRVR